MVVASSAKISKYIGKISCNVATVDALLNLEWQQINRAVTTAEPLGEAKLSLLHSALTWSPELLRVGPVIGVEKASADTYFDWTRDEFFLGQNFVGAPNALLLNTSNVERTVELKANAGAAEADHRITLARNDALIFPVNNLWFRTQGQSGYIVLRGFFIGENEQACEARNV